MYILGINAYHGDSAACIVQDGKLVAAAEEERFRRIKHWAGFPEEAIKYCLSEAGISVSDVDHFAVNSDPKANFLKKVGYTLKKRPDLKFVFDRIKNKRDRVGVLSELNSVFPGKVINAQVHQVEHHLAHLASTHLVSPFKDSVAVSVDGFGDFSSSAWGIGRGAEIEVDQRVFFPHSLGIFYQAITQFIGFPHYGDEYKVMGLAPYGKPTFIREMQKILDLHEDGTFTLNLNYFRHHKEKVEYEWADGPPAVGRLFDSIALENLFGLPVREGDMPLEQIHMDIAHSAQAMYEDAFFNVLSAAHRSYGIDRLTLAGGCAMNSVANGKVYRRSPFKQVYIQSAAGDAGGAIGSAFYVSSQVEKEKRLFHMAHAYWGPSFNNDEIGALLVDHKGSLSEQSCVCRRIDNSSELCAETVAAISEGKVIGWFQGRMEWGPRALGNRSILCDPRRTDIKDILNIKIKRRESFRPFAPSILRERVSEWFEEEDDVPFMMQVFQVKAEKRSEISAVVHVDGSGRLQTVSKEINPLYHQLISTFADQTGVPILLNTSFNENEPVVCKPEEALACFLRTKMDILVLGNFMVSRS